MDETKSLLEHVDSVVPEAIRALKGVLKDADASAGLKVQAALGLLKLRAELDKAQPKALPGESGGEGDPAREGFVRVVAEIRADNAGQLAQSVYEDLQRRKALAKG